MKNLSIPAKICAIYVLKVNEHPRNRPEYPAMWKALHQPQCLQALNKEQV